MARRMSVYLHFSLRQKVRYRKIIMGSSSASCELDHIPTTSVKSCVDELLPTITKVVNLTLTSCRIPDELKKAIVGILLKKAKLDSEILKNYHPVSNLSFISKAIEKVVASSLKDHMAKYN